MKMKSFLLTIIICGLLGNLALADGVNLSIASEVETEISEIMTETEISNPGDLFSTFSNYKYDRFDKKWKYYEGYGKEYSDANVVFGIQVYGNAKYPAYLPYLYTFIEDNSISGERTALHELTKVQLLIDDVIYSSDPVYFEDYLASIFITESNKEFLKKMGDADEIVVKLSWRTGSLELEIGEEDYAPIKRAAAYIYENDIWQFFDDASVETYLDEYYPLKITE